MGVPLKQAIKVGSYIMKQRVKGNKRYPLVLMLEPLFRCNLACAGCGKIQHPEEILKQNLTPEECFNAIEECGAPIVSIAGGEPLMHPQIGEITAGFLKRKKVVYLCTNALLLKKKMHMFKPSPYFSFSVHMDGLKERHDEMVCQEGVFDRAVEAIRAAKDAGFRVTTNTTIFEGENPDEVNKLFDFLEDDLNVDGMMVSPGYSYEKAPQQELFLKRERTRELFRQILSKKPNRKFNHTPFYMDFLEGKREYQCTAWGNPNYSVLGWQKPCYLMDDAGYAKSFKELIETTPWDQYGTGRNPKCENCMAHCGYEPTAVVDSTSSLKKMIQTARATL